MFERGSLRIVACVHALSVCLGAVVCVVVVVSFASVIPTHAISSPEGLVFEVWKDKWMDSCMDEWMVMWMDEWIDE